MNTCTAVAASLMAISLAACGSADEPEQTTRPVVKPEPPPIVLCDATTKRCDQPEKKPQ